MTCAPPASRSRSSEPHDERPNLVATLRGDSPGPVLGLLSHVDTVLADPDGVAARSVVRAIWPTRRSGAAGRRT